MSGMARNLTYCHRCGRRLRTEVVIGVLRWYCPVCSAPTGDTR